MSAEKTAFVVDPAGWCQLTPLGEFFHNRANVTQVIDRVSCEKIAAAFQERAAREGAAFPGVLLDYDHFSLDTDKPSEAAGWIVEMEVRDDGLWGRVRWTDEGLKAVTGGRYRFVSPVFPPVEELEWVDEAARKGRPVRVVSVALTNEPNIRGGRPLANRQVIGNREEVIGERDEGRGNREEVIGERDEVKETPNAERPTLNAEGGSGAAGRGVSHGGAEATKEEVGCGDGTPNAELGKHRKVATLPNK